MYISYFMKPIKHFLLFVFCTAFSITSFSKNSDTLDYQECITILEQQNKALQEQLTKVEQRTHELAMQVASNSEKVNLLGEAVEQKVGGLHEQMDSIDGCYGLRMNNAETAVQKTEARQQASVLWGVVIAIVFCLLLVAAYFILRKRIAKKGDDIELLRARAGDLNRQMVERMDKELEELQKIGDNLGNPQMVQQSGAEPDHSLVKALADRITFMEMTLFKMDPSVKGHKHLFKSIKQMKDNLLANGYELVDMLGKDYVEGMKVTASFIVDDSLEEGKQIITGIQKPQINYQGKMIQAAQITVSQNI